MNNLTSNLTLLQANIQEMDDRKISGIYLYHDKKRKSLLIFLMVEIAFMYLDMYWSILVISMLYCHY